MRNKLLSLSVLALVLTQIAGCGSANNDQGTGFTLVQFNSINETGEIECEKGTQGTDVSLLTELNAGEGSTQSQNQYLGISFENNLSGQTVRVERVTIDYLIAGAQEQPPSTTWPMGQVLPPADQGRSSLPDHTFQAPDCGYFSVMPNSILSWIDQNSNLLPDLPFTVEARVTGIGVTSSGQVLHSNALTAFVNIAPATVIPGTPPDNGVVPVDPAPPADAGSGSSSADTSASSGDDSGEVPAP